MMMRGKFYWRRLSFFSLLAAALILGGCGDDGKDGKDGVTTIIEVPAETPIATAQAESCATCHGEGRAASVANSHAYESGVALWEVDSVVPNATNDGVIIEATISVDGESRNDFGTVYRAYAYAEATNVGARYMLSDAGNVDVTLPSDTNENYVIEMARPTVAGWNPMPENITWFVILRAGDNTYPAASIVANQTVSGEPVRNIVSNDACINCHGDNIFTTATGEMGSDRSYHNSAYSVESCTVCHQRENRDNLPRYAHGIHNSNNLEGGNYKSSITIKSDVEYSVRYPAIMTDCSACHDSEASMTYILEQPVSYELCMGCHGGSFVTDPSQAWRGLSSEIDGSLAFHKGYNADTNCAACHDGNVAGADVVDYHNGYSDRGLAQKIADDNFAITIDSVTPSATAGEYTITWSAANPVTAADYNVCGTTTVAGLGNITFDPIIRLGYFEPGGDDITNPIGNNPGQPNGTQTLLNSCDAGVVTSTFTVDPANAEITRALAILKPQATVTADPALTLQGDGRVRIPAASYAFALADGASSPRRMIVDSQKCIDCHGANLYNHSSTGGRYDNVDSCIACHNSGATDQYVREELFFDGESITPQNAYDGKNAETFSMGYNMHAIHSAGATDNFYMVYRGRGLYGYGGDNTKPQNWPLDAEGNALPYLSNSADYNLTTNASGSKVPTYLKKVDYPRPLMDCKACHVDDWEAKPADQSKAVAISLDSGADLADQNDDRLVGPATGTCLSCHSNAPARGHAYGESWTPAVLDGGKSSSLEAGK